MERRKVYLRIQTPRSMKDPTARTMAMMIVFYAVAMLAVTVMVNVEGLDFAGTFTLVAAAWMVVGLVPFTLMIFNSYACVKDEDLVCNSIGLFDKRYPRSALDKAVRVGSKLRIYSGRKAIVTMPDSEAARELVRSLHIPTEL